MWLQETNYPGGPDMYWQKNLSIWYMDWGTTAATILQLMTDGLMIHRCRIIWIPIFLWLSTLILGVLADCTSSLPGGYFFAGITSQLGLAYHSVSVFLNTIMTCIICYRIIRHGRKARELLGHEYASKYFAIVNLVVESVLPYTLSGIAFLVLFGMGSAMSEAFYSIYVLMMCISPQILIIRVLTGRAWDSDMTMKPHSTIKFSPYNASGSQWNASIETKAQVQTLPIASLTNGHGKVVFATA